MTSADLIDQMQETRARNNVEWMQILRIALEADPERTKAVIKKIDEYDRDIHSLWSQLASS